MAREHVRERDRARVVEAVEGEGLDIDRPNGPVAAVLLAGGIGSAVLGLMTVLNETSPAIK